jgi:hypothetical protein
VDWFLPVIEKAEHLLQKKLLNLRGQAFSMLMENAVEHHPDQTISFAYQAIESYRNQIVANPDEQGIVYRRLAHLHEELAEHDIDHAEAHWQEALHYARQAFEVNENEADWSFYLRLIYIPFKSHPHVQVSQLTEQQNLSTLIQSVDDSAGKSLMLALGYGQFRSYLDSLQHDQTIFPHTDYEYWLDKSLDWKSAEADNRRRMDVASFYHREGRLLRNKNLLHASIRHYKVGIESMEYSAFEIYYIAETLEDLSHIAQHEGNYVEENECLQEARSYYQHHYELVASNFSTLSHYAEFSERLYRHPRILDKPSFDETRALALLAEEKGDGYYSTPGLLLMRLALDEDQEGEAIFHVTRLLILHELCIQEQIDALRQDECIESYQKIQNFLSDTIAFMEVVRKRNNYYYDPTVKWNELKTMTAEEVDDYWRKRKTEILAREWLQ